MILCNVGLWAQHVRSIGVNEDKIVSFNAIGDKYVNSELTFETEVRKFSKQPYIMYDAMIGSENYHISDNNKFIPPKAGRYTVTVDAILFDFDENGQMEEAIRNFDLDITDVPEVGYTFVNEESGLRYEITSVGNSYAVKVIGTYQKYAEYGIPASITNGGVTFAVTEIGGKAFENCNYMKSVVIPVSVTSIEDGAFSGCTGITDVTVNWKYAKSIPTVSAEMFNDIAGGSGPSSATLHTPEGTTDIYEAADVWKSFGTVTDYQMPDYLCFTAKTAGAKVRMNKNNRPNTLTLQTSTDGTEWTDYSVGTDITLPIVGDKVYFRYKGAPDMTIPEDPRDINMRSPCTDKIHYHYFSVTGKVAASGNVMSLIDRDVETTTLPGNYCFNRLFYGCTGLTSAPELPATTLTKYCYSEMFAGCKDLETAPSILPATKLENYCYEQMFYDCTSLKTVPELPATTLADYCYIKMFQGCTSLKTAPELPATTLTKNCYQDMFYSCTSLTTAPELPATALANNCYMQMFLNCKSLNDMKIALHYIGSWFDGYLGTTCWVSNLNKESCGVAANGTFTCPSNLDSNNRGKNAIPENWTVSNTFDLNVSDIGWASMYVNLPLQIPEDAEVYYAVLDGKTITLIQIKAGTTIAAGTAVIVKKPAEGSTVSFPVMGEQGTTFDANFFEGTSVAKACEANSVYVLDGNATTPEKIIFNNYTGTTLGAHKIYMPKSKVPDGCEIQIFLNSGETSVEEIKSSPSEGTPMYNLNGMCVGENYKGIVIMNGKKYMKK